MRGLVLFMLSLCLSLPAVAANEHSFGDIDVHYSAFNSNFLQPDIAAAAGLIRIPNQGVLNIAVLKAGKPLMAGISGSVRNLLGQETKLKFRQVRQGDAVYYLSQFTIPSQEMLKFTINVQQGGGEARSFSFSQEVFPNLDL